MEKRKSVDKQFEDTIFQDQNHVIKVRAFAPLLFGKSYQEEKWIKFLFDNQLIPTMCKSDPREEDLLKKFDHFVTCLEIFGQTSVYITESMTAARLEVETQRLFGTPPSLPDYPDFKPSNYQGETNPDNFHPPTITTKWMESIMKELTSKCEEEQLSKITRTKISTVIVHYMRQHFLDEQNLSGLLAFCKRCEEETQVSNDQKGKGNSLFHQSNFLGAIEAYTNALKDSPFSSVLYSNRAQTHLYMSDYRAAMWDSVRAMVLNPDAHKSYYRYAKALIQLKWKPKAIVFLRQAVERFPKQRELLEELQTLLDQEVQDIPELMSSEEEERSDDSQYQSEVLNEDQKRTKELLQQMKEHDRIAGIKRLKEKRDEEMQSRALECQQKYNEKQRKKAAAKSASAASKDVKKESPAPEAPTKISTQDVSVQTRLIDYLRKGSEALLVACYDDALEHYTEASDIIAKHTLRYFNPTKFRELDYVVLKFSLGYVEVQRGSSMELLSAVKNFKDIILAHSSVPFPLAYVGLGKAYKKLNWFPEGREWVDKGIVAVESKAKWHEYRWPGVHVIIEESRTDKLKSILLELQVIFRNPPPPDAICKSFSCHQIHHKIQVYFTDPDFKGLVKVSCHEKCVITYHYDCWKRYKKDKLASSDKDILNGPCFTPDCRGRISLIHIYDERAVKAKELKGIELPPVVKVPKEKPPRQKKSSWWSITKKLQQKEARKQYKNEKRQKREEEEAKKREAEEAAVQEELQAEKERLKTAETTENENRSKAEARMVNRVKKPVADMNDVTILKKEDETQATSAEPKLKSKGRKKGKTLKKTTIAIQPERMSDSRTVVCEKDLQEWKPKHLTPPDQLTYPVPSELNPFQVPEFVMGEVKELEHDFMNVAETSKEDIFCAFSVFLYENGPVSQDDPRLQLLISNFPPNWQYTINCYRNITAFLTEDLRFAALNGYVCLLEDSVRASQMTVPNAAMWSNPTAQTLPQEYCPPPEAQISQFIQHQLNSKVSTVKSRPEPSVDANIVVRNEQTVAETEKDNEKIAPRNKAKDTAAKDSQHGDSFDLDQFLSKGSQGVSTESNKELKLETPSLGRLGGLLGNRVKDSTRALGGGDGFVFNLPNIKAAEPGNNASSPTAAVDAKTTVTSPNIFNGANVTPKAHRQLKASETVEAVDQCSSRFEDGGSVISESSSRNDTRDLLRSMFNDSGSQSPAVLRNDSLTIPNSCERTNSVGCSSVSSENYVQLCNGGNAEHNQNNESHVQEERPASTNSMGSLSSFGGGTDHYRKLSVTTSSELSDPEMPDSDNASKNSHHDFFLGSDNPGPPVQWSNGVDKNSIGDMLFHNTLDKLTLPKHSSKENGYIDHFSSGKNSFSEGEEFDYCGGVKFGPIGSRASNTNAERLTEALNTFPSAHDENHSSLYGLPAFTAAVVTSALSNMSSSAAPTNDSTALAGVDYSTFSRQAPNFEFTPTYNFSSNPAAQINSHNIWGPPTGLGNHLSDMTFGGFSVPTTSEYGFNDSDKIAKDSVMMEHYRGILEEEACLENNMGPGVTSAKMQESSSLKHKKTQEQVDAFDQVSRLWTEAETQRNAAQEQLKQSEEEKDSMKHQLAVKEQECMRIAECELHLRHEVQELTRFLGQAQGLHQDAVAANQSLQAILQEKEHTLKALTLQSHEAAEEYEKCKQERFLALQQAETQKKATIRAQIEMLNVFQDLELMKFDKRGADLQMYFKHCATLRRSMQDTGRPVTEITTTLREVELTVTKIGQARGDFMAVIGNLKTTVADGGVLEYPLPKPVMPQLPQLPALPMPFMMGMPPGMRGVSPVEPMMSRSTTPSTGSQRSNSPLPPSSAPGMDAMRPPGRSIVQGGPFTGARPTTVTRVPQPIKPKKHQFEKLIEKIQQIFPNHSRTDIIKVIQDIRSTRGFSLSGLPLDDIVNQAALCLMEKRSPAWDQPPVTSSFKTNTEVFEEEENSCIICFESMELPQISQLECGHRFHKECIRKWFQEQNTCPNCRSHALLPEDFPALK